MKLALIYDTSGQSSYYVKDGVAYDYKNNEPYNHVHSVTPSLYMAGWM